jgi:hypothetical protein
MREPRPGRTRRHLALVAVAVGGVGVGTPAAAAPAPTAVSDTRPPPELPNEESARKLYAQRDFVRAAVAFEELWRRRGERRFLFNAALARESAGHDGRAYVLFREYLGLAGPAVEDRAAAQTSIDAIAARTCGIRIRVQGRTGSLDKLILERSEQGSEARRVVRIDPSLVTRDEDAPGSSALLVHVEPGEWRIRVQGTEGVELRTTVTAERAAPPVAAGRRGRWSACRHSVVFVIAERVRGTKRRAR